MTRNLISIVLSFFLTNILYSQYDQSPESGFHIDTVHLDDYTIVPKISAENSNNSHIENKINSWILDYYAMDNWDNEYGGRWASYSRTLSGHAIEDDILILTFAEINRGMEGTRKQFLSLNSGNQISPVDITFSSLFETGDYLKFIENFWKVDILEIVEDSFDCCDLDKESNSNYIQYYSYLVNGFSFEGDDIILKQDREGPSIPCFGACSISFEKKISIKLIYPYLNEFGKEIVSKKDYKTENSFFQDSSPESTTVNDIPIQQLYKSKAPNNYFIFGKIDGKYPFKMSINVENNGYEDLVKGFYSYDSQDEQILLKGYKENDLYEINEYTNGEITGHFTFKKLENRERTGYWTNKQNNKTLEVELTQFFN